jgi:dipeptidyl aminopeptidase/acylaminoacyl peptidase
MKISSGGGEPVPVTTLDTDRFDVAHRWPRFLPDGRRFLFYLVSTTSTVTSEHSGVYMGSLDSDEVNLVVKSESRALYAQGHLLYRRGSTLMAQPFDAENASLLADPIPVATDIPGGALSWGGAHFGVSQDGILVHMRGAEATDSILKWYDRDGNELGTLGDEAGYWDPALSHDGTRVAVSVGHDAGDIWIHDVARDVRTRFTFDTADDRGPQWSPDDSQIAFASARQSVGEIWVRPATGQGEAVLRHTSGTNITLSDWSSDGRVILFSSLAAGARSWDIWMLDTETFEATLILDGPYSESGGQLSPDGRWLAFDSDASGRDEIYVQAFPKPSGRWMVSTDGGRVPTWSADGRELFYRDVDVIMSVQVTGDSTLSFSTPERVLASEGKGSTAPEYALTPDGQRILTNERLPVDPKNMGASLIQNWTALLDR